MMDANFEKLLIPGEFTLKMLLWMIDMTPETLDDSIHFALALGLSLIIWAWSFRICVELIKKALGIGQYHRGGQ
ncbi:MAG: hypothetical protein COA45_05875 [Zetaproteobacteria bacterium]|nr:MAG: hypothetical protein COA45_05875 [Zetaproteobacteria bacterium]